MFTSRLLRQISGRTWGICTVLWFAVCSNSLGQVQRAHYQQPRNATGQFVQRANFLQGGSDVWVNAHGERIVVPASYCGEPCGGGSCATPGGCGLCNMCGGCGCPSCCSPYAGTGPYGPGGPFGCGPGLDPSMDMYGAPNIGVDQCGPHYFDFSAEFLYYDRERAADPLVNFATIGANDISAGVADALVLNTNDVDLDKEPGMRLIGRYDLGATSFLEIGYSGLFEWGGVSVLESNGDIFSGFSNFGIGRDVDGDGNVDPGEGGQGGVGLSSTDQVDSARLELLSELHNGEITFRRYWVGFSPRVTGTFLAGFRYTRLSEDLNFTTIGPAGNGMFAVQTETICWVLRSVAICGFACGKVFVSAVSERLAYSTTEPNTQPTPPQVNLPQNNSKSPRQTTFRSSAKVA